MELDKQLTRWNSLWHQKSKKLWVKEEDHNTKCIHASTLIRRKNNFILALKFSSRILSWDRHLIGN